MLDHSQQTQPTPQCWNDELTLSWFLQHLCHFVFSMYVALQPHTSLHRHVDVHFSPTSHSIKIVQSDRQPAFLHSCNIIDDAPINWFSTKVLYVGLVLKNKKSYYRWLEYNFVPVFCCAFIYKMFQSRSVSISENIDGPSKKTFRKFL